MPRTRALVGALLMPLAVSGLALAQPARVDDELDVPGLSSTQLRGDALVWEDARFFLEPWEGSTSIQFTSLSRIRRDEVGRAMPVRIVDASLRSFVEVELPNRSDCTYRRVEADRRLAGVRMFVRRSDLAPVLTRPYTATFGNGTSVKLAPGLPVAPTATGHYLISARGDKLRVPIPHEHIGYTYVHRPVVDEVLKSPVVRVDRNHTPRIDDVAFEVRQYWLAPKPARTSGENALLRWTARCVELVVSVPTTSLRPAELPSPYPNRSPYTPPGPPLGFRIPAGTPLATAEGREVAAAAAMISVGAPENDKACFDARLTMMPTDVRAYNAPTVRTFRLCADGKAVENKPAETTKVSNPDDIPAPPDVRAPPSSALRTRRGVWYRPLIPKKPGPRPRPTSTVKVHYTGWTTDGQMFITTTRTGAPGTFLMNGTNVIPGWPEALSVMSVGDRMRFWIPPELAYQGRANVPQGTLVFDIEMIAIQ